MNNLKTKKSVLITDTFIKSAGLFIVKHYKIMILMFLGYAAVSVLNFLDTATSQTIASYRIEDFEIGQIADRTIYASKSIPADEMNPIFIEEGEKIIKKGFPITEEAFNKLKKMAESPVYLDYRAFADSQLYLLLLITMWFLLFTLVPFGRKILFREYILQIICFLIVYAVSAFGTKNQLFSSPYYLVIIIPASLFVIIEAILYGQLSAIFFSFLLSFGVFNACSWEIVPFLFTLSSCLASSAIVKKIEHRMDMISVSILLAVLDTALLFFIAVIFNENLIKTPHVLIGTAFNGFLSGILALGLITPIEFLLNTASVFRMMDLSDLNNPLMRKMLITASGTYQHSQMVAQLAENACRDIGADPLLARVGAYYHDIGKIDQSEYFVENQSNGINKHFDMKPSLSAAVIRSHVRRGVEKARSLHLPQQVIDIIQEHHGNSLIAYFYEEAKKIDPNVNPADFSYPGTPPSSKESAVVMLADTVEAACHTLENPTEEKLSKFITTLINSKIEHNQLDNCSLTFRDITKIRESFVKLLVGYYHSRIKYPNQKEMDNEKKDKNLDTENSEKADTEKNSKFLKKIKTKKSLSNKKNESGEDKEDIGEKINA